MGICLNKKKGEYDLVHDYIIQGFMEEKKAKSLNFIVYIAVILISVLFIFAGHKMTKPEILEEDMGEFYKAKVTSIGEIQVEEFSFDGISSVETKKINFSAEVTNGPYKGEIIEATQDVDSMYAIQPREITKGDKIIVSPIFGDFGDELYEEWIFIEYNRMDTIIWLTLIFLLLIVVLGRGKGVSTVISLIFTILVIFTVFIPSILKGYNVYSSTIVVTLFIIFMSLTIINGANKKTLCAVAGNVGGVAVAGIIAIIMNRVLNVTGLINEEYVFLTYMQLDKPIDLVAIVWSGIVIGSLGAVMDVSMSISSSMNELAENMERKTFSNMLRSGMNIGRDVIGTMTNTLILAYVGSSLATVLLLIVYNKNVLYLFSLEMIVVEVLQAIVGSMGILFAVPATAIFSAYMFTRENKNHEDKQIL